MRLVILCLFFSSVWAADTVGDESESGPQFGIPPPLWFGATLTDVHASLRDYFALAPWHGVQVSAVAIGSPAEAAGLHTKDLILQWNDQRVFALPGHVEALLSRHHADARHVTLRVLRQGEMKQLEMRLADWPPGRDFVVGSLQTRSLLAETPFKEVLLRPRNPDSAALQAPVTVIEEGLRDFLNLSPYFGLQFGALDAQGTAAKLALQSQDILLQLGHQHIISDFRHVDAVLGSFKAGEAVEVLVLRQGKHFNVTLVLGQEEVQSARERTRQHAQPHRAHVMDEELIDADIEALRAELRRIIALQQQVLQDLQRHQKKVAP